MTTTRSEAIEFWTSAIREQSASGLTVAEYCQLIEKSTYQFYYWKRRVTGARRTTTIQREGNEQRFIELRPAGFEIYARHDYADQMDIRIGSFTIRFTGNTDRELFKTAAAVLREIVE